MTKQQTQVLSILNNSKIVSYQKNESWYTAIVSIDKWAIVAITNLFLADVKYTKKTPNERLTKIREKVKNNPLILDWNNPKFIWK